MNAIVKQEEATLQQESAQDFPLMATSSAALILDERSMDRMYKLAEIMAKGKSTIPDHLKNNVGDCMAIVMQAIQWKMNPYAVAQKTHTVNGTLGYEAQLVNAVISTSGATIGRFNYEWYGPWERIIGKTRVCDAPAKGKPGEKDYKKAYQYRVPDYGMADENGLGVRVWATLKSEDEPRFLELLLVQASVRNSPLWATDPKQQLAYLAVKRWSRLYAPDVILGVYTPDELDDGRPMMKDINEPMPKNAKPADIASRKQQQQPVASEELIKSARDATNQGKEKFLIFWKNVKPADRSALRNEMADLESRCVAADTRIAAEKEIAARRQSEKVINPQSNDDFVAAMDKADGKTDAQDDDYVPS